MGNSPSKTHRKSKSALAQLPSQPPPSYSEATTAAKSPDGYLDVDNKQKDLYGYSHSDDGSTSTSPPITNSNNPFRPRASSFNSARPSSPPTRPQLEHSTSSSKSAPKWTTPEEKADYLRRPLRQESYEDALELLRQYNTVIVVDDSGSMSGDRWLEARAALAALADTASQYDTDGIDVYFLNDPKRGNNLRNSRAVQRLFDSVRPSGLTPIGKRLDRLLRDYIDELDAARAQYGSEDSVKPVNFIILTDGAASDDVADVIVNACRRLDTAHYLLAQVGLQFVQIGNDATSTKFLRQLDDDLGEMASVRDIVDTTPYLGGKVTAEMMIKILIGGINRRVDRKGAQAVMNR